MSAYGRGRVKTRWTQEFRGTRPLPCRPIVVTRPRLDCRPTARMFALVEPLERGHFVELRGPSPSDHARPRTTSSRRPRMRAPSVRKPFATVNTPGVWSSFSLTSSPTRSSAQPQDATAAVGLDRSRTLVPMAGAISSDGRGSRSQFEKRSELRAFRERMSHENFHKDAACGEESKEDGNKHWWPSRGW